MLIGNEAKVTPYPLVEGKTIKKLTPNVKIKFGLKLNTADKIKTKIGYCPML